MKSERSVIRDAVHVGQLIIARDLSFLPEKEDPTEVNYIIEDSMPCRSILFVIDKKRYARDILYDSPRYPIVGVTEDKYCVIEKGEEKAIIFSRWCLAELLSSLGYPSILTKKDIQRIRNTLFDSLASERLRILSGYLYERYRECIKTLRDKSLKEAFFDKNKTNSFKPIEEQILKRKR